MKTGNDRNGKLKDKDLNAKSGNSDFFSDANYRQMSLDDDAAPSFLNDAKKNKEDESQKTNRDIKTETTIKDSSIKNDQLQIPTEENITNEEKEKFEEYQEAVKKQSGKKKKWLGFIFLLINIGVVAGILAYQLTSDSQTVASFSEFASNINWGIFFLIFVVFMLITFLETARVWILCYKATKKNRPALAFKIAALGRYYDNITPFASGEQPFQVYYLNKRGVPAAEALSIPMGKYVIWQLAFVTFTFIVMIFSISITGTGNSPGETVVTAGGWIGFAINSALMVLIAIISISRTVGTKLISGILRLLHKIKLIKNYDKQYNKIMGLVNDYQSTMRKYAKDKWAFISVFLLTYLTFLFQYSLPFLIHAAFYGFDFSIFSQIFTYCVMIDLTAGFLPLPGGTGAAELSFTALFGLYFSVNGNLFWALIIWRIFTFYGYIIQGIFIMIYDYFVGNRKHRWEQKMWVLQAESRSFEESHLKDFELSLIKDAKKIKRRK
jgi:uncharacterized protein (TIRG00374 family)